MDRPSRKTKAVDYRESSKDFDDCDDDDDFVKAPPSKKVREDRLKQREPKKPLISLSSQETTAQSTLCQKSRKPLDEKLFERDLEAAITLSSLNYTDNIKDQPPASKGVMKVLISVDENTDPASRHLSNCSVDAAVLGLDEISSETGSPASSRQRKASAVEQKQALKDEDEDYRPKLTPDSESDDDFSEAAESEDEEFAFKKVSTTKKKENVVTKKEKTKSSQNEKQPPKAAKTKSTIAASTPVRSPPAAKTAPRRPAQSSTLSTPKPSVSLSPAGGRIPKWNPPGQIGRSPTSSLNPAVKSPGQGLRLGLSRRVRVKPLHPSVTSH